MNRQSLKYRLAVFMGTVILLMAVINTYSIYNTKNIEVQYRSMLQKMISVSTVGQYMNNSLFYLDRYFTTNDQSDLNNYRKYYDLGKKTAQDIDTSSQNQGDILVVDLQNIIESYYEAGETTVFTYLSAEPGDIFYSSFQETKQVSSYVTDYVYMIYDGYLKINNNLYSDIVSKNQSNRIIITVSFVGITVLCIIFALVFSRRITVPIIQLVRSTEKVSKGDFNIPHIKTMGLYEIDILASGFNVMVEDINELVGKIKENANVEQKLKDEEMKNLLSSNMLKEAQLKLLQSQINPHFLFNTLNTVVQTAMIEDAPQTEKLINSVSDLLRYSLNKVDQMSTMKNELDVIEQYIYIQEVRFKDRVKFILDVDTSLHNLQVPGMILQPLVENAFKHGIECREEGGQIFIRVWKEDKFCFIAIEDNGIGMSAEKVIKLMENKQESSIDRYSGIGVSNVINRLRLLYKNEDVFKIESELTLGTKIYIKIPLH